MSRNRREKLDQRSLNLHGVRAMKQPDRLNPPSCTIVAKEILVELGPSLSSCIETLAKREYEKTLSAILKAGTEDEELCEKWEVLRLFLESTDFGTLRSRYERLLEGGKRVKFGIYSSEGKVGYGITVCK